MTLPRTGGAEWAASQASPWETVNLVLRLLDAGACRFLIEDRDLTAPPGSCADGSCYLVAASPTGAWSGKAGKLAVAIGANAANGWQFMTVAIEGVDLYVRDENITIEYNGSAWVTSSGLQPGNNLSELASPATARVNLGVSDYRVGFFFTTAPSGSEVLALHVATSAFTFPANFASPTSKGAVGTNPAASFAMDVQKNGSTIGTITISTGGVFTFATASGTAKSVAVGDVIKIVAPATPDASIANAAITLVGTF